MTLPADPHPYRATERGVFLDDDPGTGLHPDALQITKGCRVLVGDPFDHCRSVLHLFQAIMSDLQVLACLWRDGVSMRIARRMSKCCCDPVLDFLREGMFQPVGLVMHPVPRDAEGFVKVGLEESMVPHDLEGGYPASPCQLDPLITLVLDVSAGGQLLDHRSYGRGANAKPLGDGGCRYLSSRLPYRVDRFQVVLSRGACVHEKRF